MKLYKTVNLLNLNTPPANPQYNGNIAEWDNSFLGDYIGTSPNNKIDIKFNRTLNQYDYDISGRLIKSNMNFSHNRATPPMTPTDAFSATFNYDLNGNMYNIDRKNDVGNSATYEIDIKDMTNQLAQTSHGGNSYSYTFDAMGQMITEKHISGSSTFEDVVDSIAWTADGKIEFVEDGTWMTYPDDDPMDGDWSAPEVLMIKKHYYYDGMGNRVAIVTQDPSGMIESYCLEDFGDFEHSVEECLVEHDHTVDTYFYEAGGKLLYKNKFAVRNTVTDYSPAMNNDVEWYVYGSASDGRVATVYPRYKIRDNETFDDNFEYDPPSLEVAYNTEMVSNTFTSNAVSASITGIETHRHLGEKRYEIKDHLGNVRAVTSDIKYSNNYNDVVSSWKFLADIKSMSNYYPYGLKINEGSWSATNYQFAYNGKQEEVFDKNFLDFGARSYNSKYNNFIKTDAWEVRFPNQSPYVYGGNNPILNVDVNGDWAWVANSWLQKYNKNNNIVNKINYFGISAVKFTDLESRNLEYMINSQVYHRLNNKGKLYSPAIANYIREETIVYIVSSEVSEVRGPNVKGFTQKNLNLVILNDNILNNKDLIFSTVVHETVHNMGEGEIVAYSVQFSMGFLSKDDIKSLIFQFQIDSEGKIKENPLSRIKGFTDGLTFNAFNKFFKKSSINAEAVDGSNENSIYQLNPANEKEFFKLLNDIGNQFRENGEVNNENIEKKEE